MATIRQSSDAGNPASTILHAGQMSADFVVGEAGLYALVAAGLRASSNVQLSAEVAPGIFVSLGNNFRVRAANEGTQRGSLGIYDGVRNVRLHKGRFRIVASAAGATCRLAGAGT